MLAYNVHSSLRMYHKNIFGVKRLSFTLKVSIFLYQKKDEDC